MDKNAPSRRRSVVVMRPLPALRDNRAEAEKEAPPRKRKVVWCTAKWKKEAPADRSRVRSGSIEKSAARGKVLGEMRKNPLNPAAWRNRDPHKLVLVIRACLAKAATKGRG